MEAAYGCECQFHLTRIDEQQHETEEKEMTKTNIATLLRHHTLTFPFSTQEYEMVIKRTTF